MFIVLCGYFIAAHYWFLGFNTWDGLSYRIPPMVEFVQHGNLGGDKFHYIPAKYFYPFFEWIHVPFLKILGMPGLYFSFSITLLPLSIFFVYLFIKELTGDSTWATHGALVYLAIPFVNTQPFSGYIDFAVIGALAFFLYALLRGLRSRQSSFWILAVLSLATFLFSMSRQHAPYLSILIVATLAGWFLAPWDRSSAAKEHRWRLIRRLPLLLIAFVIGIAPAAFLHLSRYLEFGSPIFPFQLKFLGITTSGVFTRDAIESGSGLMAPTWNGMLASFRRGWLWPPEWPRDFFDSRILGVGLLCWILWITLPLLDRIIDRTAGFLLLFLVALAILIQDFWLPRYSMTLILTLIIGIGGALAWLASNGPSWGYGLLMLAVFLHLGRPVYDLYTMKQMGRGSIRVNIANSPLFIGGEISPGELKIYPDLHANLTVVHPLDNEFSLLLYGRDLSNQIVGTLEPSDVNANCLLEQESKGERKSLIVDQQRRLAAISDACAWVCELSRDGRCLAGELVLSE